MKTNSLEYKIVRAIWAARHTNIKARINGLCTKAEFEYCELILDQIANSVNLTSLQNKLNKE